MNIIPKRTIPDTKVIVGNLIIKGEDWLYSETPPEVWVYSDTSQGKRSDLWGRGGDSLYNKGFSLLPATGNVNLEETSNANKIKY